MATTIRDAEVQAFPLSYAIIERKITGSITDIIAPKVQFPLSGGAFEIVGDVTIEEVIDDIGSPTTTPNTFQRSLKSVAYNCKYRALSESSIDPDLRKLDLHRPAAETVQNMLDFNHEYRLAKLFSDSAQYPSTNTVTLTSAQQWDNVTSADSNPVDVIETAKLKIAEAGLPATHIIATSEVLRWIADHPETRKRRAGGDLYKPTPDAIRTYFDLIPVAADRIAGGTKIWGKNCIIAHLAPKGDVKVLNAQKRVAPGFAYSPTTIMEGEKSIWKVVIFKKPGADYPEVKVAIMIDEVIAMPELGYLIQNAIS
jgi:hypothetical protein